MRVIYSILIVLICSIGYSQKQKKIGSNTYMINSSAVLELESTNKGLLLPRLTTLQRDAIVLPAEGLVIYNTTTKQIETNAGTAILPNWTVGDGTSDATTTVKGKIKLAGDLGGTADLPIVPGLANKEDVANKSTNTALGTSDVLYPTQNAVKSYVDTQVASATITDATTTVKGKIQLAGDLTGTADTPIVATGAITSTKILDGTIANQDVADGTLTGSKLHSMSASMNQVLKWNGLTWIPATDDNTTYSGSATVSLNGTHFERAALTGDVVAGANSNVTTISNGAVTTEKILDGTIATADIANESITLSKLALPVATTVGQVIKWNGSSWVTALDSDTTYSAGSGVTIASGSITVDDATTMSKGKVQLAGDLTGTATLPLIANDAVTTDKILNGTILSSDIADAAITATKIDQMAATNGQVLKWNGTVWAPAADVDTNTTYTGSSTIALNGTSFERKALVGDVTAPVNSNSTTISNNAISSAKIIDGAVASTDLADGAVTASKLNQMGATNGQVLKWSGSSWVASPDSDTTYLAGSGVTINTSNEVSVNDATTSLKGKIKLAGDLGGTADLPTVPDLINKENITNKSANITLGTSNVLYPTQNAVKSYVDSQIASSATPDATTIVKGKIKLAGDLTGTAAAPTIATSAITSTKILDATIATADLADGSITAPKLNQMGAISGQVIKWNGTSWAPAADTDTNTTYTGSTSISLNGSTFERAALTGDVTASANSNSTTIATGAVTSAKILDGTIATADLANGSVTAAKMNQMSATSGQVLKWNGTAWAPATDNDTTYSAGAGVSITTGSINVVDATTTVKGKIKLSGDLGGTADLPTVPDLVNKENLVNKSTDIALGTSDVLYPTQNAVKSYVDTQITSVTIPDATTIVKGKIKLAGDLTGTAAVPTVANNVITSAKISDGTIATIDISDGAVDSNKILDATIVTADLANESVSSAKIIDGTIATADIATGAVTAAKLNQMSATSGQVLKWNGTAWAPAADTDTNTVYTAGSGIAIAVDGTVTANDATTSSKGIVQLAGDLAGSATLPNIANNAVTSAKILDATVATADLANAAVTTTKLADAAVTAVKLNQMGATDGQALIWNGTTLNWQPTTVSTTNLYTGDGSLAANRIVSQADKTLAFTSTATTGTSHFTVDGTTFNVDAVNNRIGIGTSSPQVGLEVKSGAIIGNSQGTASSSINSSILNVWSPSALNGTVASRENVMRMTRGGTSGSKWNMSADFLLGTYNTGLNSQSQLDIRLANGGTNDTDTDVMTLRADGKVGINTTNPSTALDVNGQIKISGGTL